MRFAYADPPYPGKARKYYKGHDDYGGEVDHAALIEHLEGNYPDGWALSTGAESLRDILPLCPAPEPRGAAGGGVRHRFRVLSWCKPLAQPGGNPGPLYGWEPLILRGGRRDPDYEYPRDWLVCSPELYTLRRKPDEHVTGAKPPDFCRWMFRCLGAQPGDEPPSRARCCSVAPGAASSRLAPPNAQRGAGLGPTPLAAPGGRTRLRRALPLPWPPSRPARRRRCRGSWSAPSAPCRRRGKRQLEWRSPRRRRR